MISEQYRKLNERLHKQEAGYGTSAIKNLDNVLALIDDACAIDLLDYGCGKQVLRQHLRGIVAYTAYDPCIPSVSKRPEGIFDIVLCTDVMEHVEPDYVDAVLEDVFNYARRAIYFTISTVKGSRVLADGKPAHRSVHSAEWWLERLAQYGKIEQHGQISQSKELVATLWK